MRGVCYASAATVVVLHDFLDSQEMLDRLHRENACCFAAKDGVPDMSPLSLT